MFQFFCIILSLHTQFPQWWSFSWLPLTFQKIVDSHSFAWIYPDLAEFSRIYRLKVTAWKFHWIHHKCSNFFALFFLPILNFLNDEVFPGFRWLFKNCWFALVYSNLSEFSWIYPIIFQMSTAPWRCEQISIFSTFPTQHNLPKPTGPSFPPLPNICDWFNLIKFIRI